MRKSVICELHSFTFSDLVIFSISSVRRFASGSLKSSPGSSQHWKPFSPRRSARWRRDERGGSWDIREEPASRRRPTRVDAPKETSGRRRHTMSRRRDWKPAEARGNRLIPKDFTRLTLFKWMRFFIWLVWFHVRKCVCIFLTLQCTKLSCEYRFRFSWNRIKLNTTVCRFIQLCMNVHINVRISGF